MAGSTLKPRAVIGESELRILVISHMYPTLPGGVRGLFVHQQVKALIDQGCEVEVVCPVPRIPPKLGAVRNKWRRLARMPPRLRHDGVTVYHPKYVAFPRGMFLVGAGQRMGRSVLKFVRQGVINDSFDLIHAHVAVPDGLCGLMLKAVYKRPFVVTIHGQDLQTTVCAGRRAKQAVGQVLTSAERAIFVSHKLKSIADRLFPQVKGAVSGNGVPSEVLETAPRGARYSKLVVSLSNLVPSKGLERNIAVLARLAPEHTDLRYRIIGGGPDHERLSRLASRLGVSSRIEFCGEQPNAEALRLMSEGTIFSLPSRPEGFGVCYLEAMALCLSVIGVKGEGIEDVITDGYDGVLVDLDDPTALERGWRELLADPRKAAAIGERARKLVQRKHTWDKKALELISFYREVMSAVPVRAAPGRA